MSTEELVCRECGRDDYDAEALNNYLFVDTNNMKFYCSNCDDKTLLTNKEKLMNNRETLKVFQILLTSEEVAKVNAEGHGSVPKHSARTDMHFSDNPQTLAFDAMEKGYYTHVANITTDRDPELIIHALERVFEIGNNDEELERDNDSFEMLTRMQSISVGNVIERENGDQYVVAEYGFKRLPVFAFPAE